MHRSGSGFVQEALINGGAYAYGSETKLDDIQWLQHHLTPRLDARSSSSQARALHTRPLRLDAGMDC